MTLLCGTVMGSSEGVDRPSHVEAYTNHAGEVIVGRVVSIQDREVTLFTSPTSETLHLPLSIFPKAEQRRICAHTAKPRLPEDIRSAYEGYRNMVSRSQSRAAAGLCTKAESDQIVRRATAVFTLYLNRSLQSGKILPEEEKRLRDSLIQLPPP